METNIYKPEEELLIETQKGEFERIEQLINEKVNINHQDEQGNTALHYAVRYGYLKIVKCLLRNGADINIENASVETPLDIADKTPRSNIKEIQMALYEKVIDKSFNIIEKFVEEETWDGGSNSPEKDAERDPKIIAEKIINEIKRKENKIKTCLNSLKILNQKENESNSKLTYEQANHFIFFLEAFSFKDFNVEEESEKSVQDYFAPHIPDFKGFRKLIDDIRTQVCGCLKTKITIEDITTLLPPNKVNFFRMLERNVTYICNNIDSTPNGNNMYVDMTKIFHIDQTPGIKFSSDGIFQGWEVFVGAIHEEDPWDHEKSQEMLFNFLVNISPAIKKESQRFDKLRNKFFEDFPQIDIKNKLIEVFPLKIVESYQIYAGILNKIDSLKDKIQLCLDYIKEINKEIDPVCSKFTYKHANAFIFFLGAFQFRQNEEVENYFKKLFPSLCDDLEMIKTAWHCLSKTSNKIVAIEDMTKLVASDLDIVTFFKKLEDYVTYACNEIIEFGTTAEKATHIDSILAIDEDLGTNCEDVLKETLLNLLKVVVKKEEWTEEQTHEILFNFLVNIPPEGDEEVCRLDSLRRSVISNFNSHKDEESVLKREFTKAVFELRSILFKYYYAKEVIDIFHRIEPGEDYHKIDADLRHSLNKTEEEFENTFIGESTLIKISQNEDVEYPFFQSSLNPIQEELALSVLTKHYFKYMTIIDDDTTAIYYDNSTSCRHFNIRRILINEFINLKHIHSSTSKKYFQQKKNLRNSLVAYDGVKEVFYNDMCRLHIESGNCQEKKGNKLEWNCFNQTKEISDNQQENNSYKDKNKGNNEENKGNKENNRGNIEEANSKQRDNDVIEQIITDTLTSLLRLQRYYQISHQEIVFLYKRVVDENMEFDIANYSDLLRNWIAPNVEKPSFKILENQIKKWHKTKFIEYFLNEKIITINVFNFIRNIFRTFYDAKGTYNIKFVNVEEAFSNQLVLTNLVNQEIKFWKVKDSKGYYLFMVFKKLLKLRYAAPFLARLIIEEETGNVMEKEDFIKLAEDLIDKDQHIYELTDLLNVSCEGVDLYEIVLKKMLDKDLKSMRPIIENPHHLEIILKHLQKSITEESNDRFLTLEYNIIKYLNSTVRKMVAVDQNNKAHEIAKVYTKHPIGEKSLAKFELLKAKNREIRIINYLGVLSKRKNESNVIAVKIQEDALKKCYELKTALENMQENSVEFSAVYLLSMGSLAYTMQQLGDYSEAFELFENIYQRIKNFTLHHTPVTIPIESTKEERPSDFADIIKSKNYSDLLNYSSQAAKFLDILKIKVNMAWLFVWNSSKYHKSFMSVEKQIDFYHENIERFKEIYITTRLEQPGDRNVEEIMWKIAFMNNSASRTKEYSKRSETEVFRHLIESLQFYNGVYNLQKGYSDLTKTTLQNIFRILDERLNNGCHGTNAHKNRTDKIREIFFETLRMNKYIKKYGNQN